MFLLKETVYQAYSQHSVVCSAIMQKKPRRICLRLRRNLFRLSKSLRLFWSISHRNFVLFLKMLSTQIQKSSVRRKLKAFCRILQQRKTSRKSRIYYCVDDPRGCFHVCCFRFSWESFHFLCILLSGYHKYENGILFLWPTFSVSARSLSSSLNIW